MFDIHVRVSVILIVEDPIVTVKCRTLCSHRDAMICGKMGLTFFQDGPGMSCKADFFFIALFQIYKWYKENKKSIRFFWGEYLYNPSLQYILLCKERNKTITYCMIY